MLRWREFGVLRWLGLGLLLLGGSILFSGDTWWAGLILVVAGLVLIERDNGRMRRSGRLNSAERDSDG